MKITSSILVLCLLATFGCKEINHRYQYGNLTVIDNNDNTKVLRKNRGDEVMLGAIYFTSQFGSPGSTKVITKRILKLGNNVDPGESVNAGYLNFQSDEYGEGLGSTDLTKVKPYLFTQEELNDLDVGPTITGVAIIAVEEDQIGDSQLNTQLNNGANNLREGLQVFVESEAYEETSAAERPRYILGAISNAQNYRPGASGGLSGGGYDGDPITILSTLFFGIPLNIMGNIGHDLIEVSAIINIGVEQGANPLFDLLYNACNRNLSPSNLKICSLDHNGPVSLEFSGEDAIWHLDLRHSATVVE